MSRKISHFFPFLFLGFLFFIFSLSCIVSTILDKSFSFCLSYNPSSWAMQMRHQFFKGEVKAQGPLAEEMDHTLRESRYKNLVVPKIFFDFLDVHFY